MSKRKGRPPFQVSPEIEAVVDRLALAGISHLAIARAIGVDRRTLSRHFGERIARISAVRRAAIVQLLFESARRGSFSAQKRLESLTAAACAAQAARNQHKVSVAITRFRPHVAVDNGQAR